MCVKNKKNMYFWGMDFFTTVEFYIIAITIAVLVAGFFLKSHKNVQPFSYIYQGNISFTDSLPLSDEECVEVISQEDGTVWVVHRNVFLPMEATVNMKIDVCGDDVNCVEKMMERIPDEPVFCCDVKFKVKCLKYLTYKMRYESVHNGKWCSLSFTNNGSSSEKKDLKH